MFVSWRICEGLKPQDKRKESNLARLFFSVKREGIRRRERNKKAQDEEKKGKDMI